MSEISEELTAILDLPKVELHTHYEGAAPAAFIRGLAKEKNVDLSVGQLGLIPGVLVKECSVVF